MKTYSLKFETIGDGQMASRIKVHFVLGEDPGGSPSPNAVSQNNP